jgi:hypothetical protein
MIIMTIWASTDSNGDLRPAAGFGLGLELEHQPGNSGPVEDDAQQYDRASQVSLLARRMRARIPMRTMTNGEKTTIGKSASSREYR